MVKPSDLWLAGSVFISRYRLQPRVSFIGLMDRRKTTAFSSKQLVPNNKHICSGQTGQIAEVCAEDSVIEP